MNTSFISHGFTRFIFLILNHTVRGVVSNFNMVVLYSLTIFFNTSKENLRGELLC